MQHKEKDKIGEVCGQAENVSNALRTVQYNIQAFDSDFLQYPGTLILDTNYSRYEFLLGNWYN